MSPRNMEPISPMNSRFSVLSQREKQQQFRSLSSRDLGSSNGKLDWAVSADEWGKHRRSNENIEEFDEDGIVCAPGDIVVALHVLGDDALSNVPPFEWDYCHLSVSLGIMLAAYRNAEDMNHRSVFLHVLAESIRR
ncbi:hypothetical protein K1719_032130 [Acacia pycnantha]|nr:hypothetical protein K1719_032130 [Acacia pycnantha]